MTYDPDDIEVCRECGMQCMCDAGEMDEGLGFICDVCYHEEAFLRGMGENKLQLSEKGFDSLVETLENPPKANNKLLEAAKRYGGR